jgi:hypothetical protein
MDVNLNGKSAENGFPFEIFDGETAPEKILELMNDIIEIVTLTKEKVPTFSADVCVI